MRYVLQVRGSLVKQVDRERVWGVSSQVSKSLRLGTLRCCKVPYVVMRVTDDVMPGGHWGVPRGAAGYTWLATYVA